jgi:hypothetical protein
MKKKGINIEDDLFSLLRFPNENEIKKMAGADRKRVFSSG